VLRPLIEILASTIHCEELSALVNGEPVSFDTPKSDAEDGPATVVQCWTIGMIGRDGRRAMSNDSTGMAGMSQEELEQLVRDEYARLRAAWFPDEKPGWLPAQVWPNSQQPAVLSFVWDDPNAHCVYVFQNNSLIIAAEEGWLQMGKDLEEGEVPTAVYTVNAQHKFTRDWSLWRVFLLHEMCHEYQFKVFYNHDRSAVGRDMFHAAYCARNRPVKFEPTGCKKTCTWQRFR